MFRFGTFLFLGIGMDKDEAEGVRWFRKAARAGNKDARKVLRQMDKTW